MCNSIIQENDTVFVEKKKSLKFTYLVFVFSLDEEGKSESHLCQLCDANAILRAIKLWGVVILVD